MRRSFCGTWMFRSTGGNARCGQSVRSQMRQLTPMRTAGPSSRDSFRVDELRGIGRLAAQAHRVVPIGQQVRARTFDDGAADAEIAHAVRHLGELHQDLARMPERFVDVPERTCAAEARELKARRAVALGDIAGPIHAHEIERNSARAGPLQCAQPMTDLFEAGVIQTLHLFDIVTQLSVAVAANCLYGMSSAPAA